MDLGLAGKVAMVAAASRGIGRASALALAREGCRVSVCGRGAASLEEARAELARVGPAPIAVVADVAVAADLARWHAETVAQLGAPDILVCNTGGPPVSRFEALTDAQWAAGWESTSMSAVRLCRLLLPAMRERKGGRIVLLTSLVAREPSEELTVSSTLRAGLSALTRTLARQVGDDGITVNAVLMGHIRTERQIDLADRRAKASGSTREQVLEQTAAEVPLKRFGEPEEVGAVVAFLASAQASYVSGVSLLVDGGISRSV